MAQWAPRTCIEPLRAMVRGQTIYIPQGLTHGQRYAYLKRMAVRLMNGNRFKELGRELNELAGKYLAYMDEGDQREAFYWLFGDKE